MTISSSEENRRDFATTQWHIVRNAGAEDSTVSRSALQDLCQLYWYPLYAFVRRQGHDSNAAADLTQAFFADLLQRDDLKKLDPNLGKFRSFLLASIKHFMINEWNKQRAQKRGGGQTVLSIDFTNADQRYRLLSPVEAQTPETLFERQWAFTLLEQVNRRLEKEFEQRGKKHVFEKLKVFLGGRSQESTLAQAAAQLNLTEVAAKVTVHRMRTRFGQLLQMEIANTLEEGDDVQAEIEHLFRILKN